MFVKEKHIEETPEGQYPLYQILNPKIKYLFQGKLFLGYLI
jgi:hypothetical protein